MTDPAPDACPVHDLDPGATVWVRVGDATLPYSAAHACAMHHEATALQPVIDRALAAALAATVPHTVIPPAFRRN